MHISRNETRIFFTIAAMLWIYLGLRAWYVPLVHDEIATFFHYIQRKEFLPFLAHWDANNHILNSGLSILSYSLFGNSPFALRLPNLLFFPLYAIYTFRLGKFIENRWVRLGLWIALLFPHNLVEFLALTRGYGMSMALLLASVYHLIRYVKSCQSKQLLYGLLFLFFAMTANLTLTNTALLVFAFLVGLALLDKKYRKPIPVLLTLILNGGMIGLAAILSFEMKRQGLLYYGEGANFWSVTVHSLAELIAGRESFFVEFLLAILTGISVLLAFFIVRKKSSLFTPGFLFFFLFIGNIIATLSLHFIMGVNFPEDRTGMYFYYFLVLSICFLADYINVQSGKKLSLIPVFAVYALPVFFLFQVNLIYSAQWKEEHYPLRFYKKVLEENNGHENEVGIGGYTIQRLVWAYYSLNEGGKLNLMQTADFPNYDYDYLLFTEDMVEKAGGNYTIIDSDPYSGLHLLKRKQPHPKTFWKEIRYLAKREFKDQPFFTLFEDGSDSLAGKSVYFDLSMEISSGQKPFIGAVICSITDKDENTAYYEMQELNWLQSSWEPGDIFHHGLYVYNIPENTKRVVLYIWDIHNKGYSTQNISLKIYEVDTGA